MSSVSIERDTSSASTTFRERTCTFTFDWPHWGRATAKRMRASPVSSKKACMLNSRGLDGISRVRSPGATNESRRLSARARRKNQNAPATGTSATNINIQG